MLLFQWLLFGGYAYAHVLSHYLKVRHQVVVHLSLLLLSLSTLPISPSDDWKPDHGSTPVLLILGLLLCKVGMPYFLLSSTGPLLQSWLSKTDWIERPYRLYSLSNVGSMLALLSFPFVFERVLSSPQQAWWWGAMFAVYVMLCALTSVWIGLRSKPTPVSCERTSKKSVAQEQRLNWAICAAIPSALLLATTNQVCQDTAVVPFLWVLPLAIYLLTFILTFESDRWYSRRPCIMLAAISMIGMYIAKLTNWHLPLMVEIGIHFCGMFFASMVCHGELAQKKPAREHLTAYYLTISAGGAIGGMLVGIVAPAVFSGFFEYPLMLLICVLFFLSLYLESNHWWRTRFPHTGKWAMAICIPIVAALWLSVFNAQANHQLIAKRNFYGVLSVIETVDEKTQSPIRKLVHGRIVHGSQFLPTSDKPDAQRIPTTYYTRASGIGITMQSLEDQPKRIGVVGLGTGTLATYGRKGDVFRFYEINEDVVDLATNQFRFMSDSLATCECILGDARLVLDREQNQELDVLVLDAFSGDAIPVHLLTSEAFDVYERHLKPDGILAIHISNLYFDLQTITHGIAIDRKMGCRIVASEEKPDDDAHSATWAILTREPSRLAEMFDGMERTWLPSGKPVRWTDERSNLFDLLK
jgi:SAM-dependent methyltransferase